jgi:hypothetical protein
VVETLTKPMNAKQEPKYTVRPDGTLVNRQSGEPIPADEPIFILRARDRHAVTVLVEYSHMVIDTTHAKAVSLRAQQFADWAKAHPERMKEPDTVLTDDWQHL